MLKKNGIIALIPFFFVPLQVKKRTMHMDRKIHSILRKKNFKIKKYYGIYI